jgi:propanol-preferring alcohol dehydrogenase
MFRSHLSPTGSLFLIQEISFKVNPFISLNYTNGFGKTPWSSIRTMLCELLKVAMNGQTMRAMLLEHPHQSLVLKEIPKPKIRDDELLVKVHVCGVCRTDLHVKDGELAHPKLPLVLGHEIVGTIEQMGKHVRDFQIGERVGIPWLGGNCRTCEFCQQGLENLCEQAQYTGYNRDGGYAEYTTCRADMAIPLPKGLSDTHIAPLLCAGLIGYRSYRKAAPQKSLGIYGFGAAAHIITQLAVYEGKEVYAFTRKGDDEGQQFAKKLGAIWAGDSFSPPPVLLDAVIIFAPVGELVPLSLQVLKKGGRCICGGIHMSDIPTFPYRHLWGEKSIQSVANLTRRDAQEFFALLSKCPIRTEVTTYPLNHANQALEDLRNGTFRGAAVLEISI